MTIEDDMEQVLDYKAITTLEVVVKVENAQASGVVLTTKQSTTIPDQASTIIAKALVIKKTTIASKS
jgi:hypothetical protein